MSEAVYDALKFGAGMTHDAFWALEYCRLARDTGWSWEYIEGLDLAFWRTWFSVRDGETKASPNWNG